MSSYQVLTTDQNFDFELSLYRGKQHVNDISLVWTLMQIDDWLGILLFFLKKA